MEDCPVREWLQEKLGVGGAVVVLVVAVGLLVYFVFGQKSVARRANERVFICSETGKVFRHVLQDGERYPIYSPYSDKNTGFPAEACYWTKDGGVKLEPTYVLLNTYIGKEGPTICPDCGRKVYDHNPMPPPEKFEELRRQQASK
jgi:hypothetical protein